MCCACTHLKAGVHLRTNVRDGTTWSMGVLLIARSSIFASRQVLEGLCDVISRCPRRHFDADFYDLLLLRCFQWDGLSPSSNPPIHSGVRGYMWPGEDPRVSRGKWKWWMGCSGDEPTTRGRSRLWNDGGREGEGGCPLHFLMTREHVHVGGGQVEPRRLHAYLVACEELPGSFEGCKISKMSLLG